MKYDVFISYSSHDQKIVEGICGYLEARGIRCFVAYRDIPRGVVWARAIVEALDDSRMMLVAFSQNFNRSEQVDREIELASNDHKPILTFRLSNDNFQGAKKYYLQNLNWIDAFPDPNLAFGNLYKDVCKLLGITPTEDVNLHLINSHEYVDLDLPSGVKWATSNVGASNPEEYGEYFAWGETRTKEFYRDESYELRGKSIAWLRENGYLDESDNLTPEHDVARQEWGGTWRIPTKKEIKELLEHTTQKWTFLNKRSGYLIESKSNSKSIFLPAAGYKVHSDIKDPRKDGMYWSATLCGNYQCEVPSISFFAREISVFTVFENGLAFGFSVRPVSD